MGDDRFVEEMQARLEPDNDLSEIPSSQKRKMVKPIRNYFDQSSTRNDSIYRAYRSEGYSMKAIADAIDLHYSTVSKIIKAHE